MADERVREMLRELRERYGVRMVPEPPEQVLLWLQREAAFERGLETAFEHGPETPGGMDNTRGLLVWLRSFGSDRLCLAHGPSNQRCERTIRHEGNHARTTKVRGRREWEVATGTCIAHDPGRWHCHLPVAHGGQHDFRPELPAEWSQDTPRCEATSLGTHQQFGGFVSIGSILGGGPTVGQTDSHLVWRCEFVAGHEGTLHAWVAVPRCDDLMRDEPGPRRCVLFADHGGQHVVLPHGSTTIVGPIWPGRGMPDGFGHTPLQTRSTS